jgi:Mrp family chromosome partitioning ATPase
LRRGSLSRQFDLPNLKGLGEIVNGEATLKDCATATIYENLSLLARGRELSNCSENFLSRELRDCLREAAEHFQFVIIDSAPVLVADDTTTLAPMIDTTLFVMRINATPARLAERALGQLYSRQVNVGGVVINCEHVSTSDYRAYGYYNYYYPRGSGEKTESVLDTLRNRRTAKSSRSRPLSQGGSDDRNKSKVTLT